jgi:hypothetical protein
VDTGDIYDMAFALDKVSFISAVDVELATTYGEDIALLVITPTGEEYVLMEDSVAVEGEEGTDLEDFDLGVKAADPSLRNVAKYTFVESGGEGFESPYSPAIDDEGNAIEYNAEAWGGVDAPYDAGEWILLIADNAAGDACSVGTVTIRYCGICVSSDSNTISEPSPSAAPFLDDDSSQIPVAFPTAEPLTDGEPTSEAIFGTFPPAFFTNDVPTVAPTFEGDESFGPAFVETSAPTMASRGTQQYSPDTTMPSAEGGCTDVVLDFDTLADGTNILGGSYLWNEYKDEFGVVLSASGGFLQFPRLFNTANANDEEAHLGSPNELCQSPGPGVGVGGEPDAVTSNCEPLGNVLIIQDTEDTSQPKDTDDGGVISFIIDSDKVESVNEIGLFSIDSIGTTIKVAHFTSSGKKAPKFIDVDAAGENSVQTISIERERVFQVDVNMSGRGAVSFLKMCVYL